MKVCEYARLKSQTTNSKSNTAKQLPNSEHGLNGVGSIRVHNHHGGFDATKESRDELGVLGRGNLRAEGNGELESVRLKNGMHRARREGLPKDVLLMLLGWLDPPSLLNVASCSSFLLDAVRGCPALRKTVLYHVVPRDHYVLVWIDTTEDDSDCWAKSEHAP